MLVDDGVERRDVARQQGIDAPLLDSGHGVFGGLRHGIFCGVRRRIAPLDVSAERTAAYRGRPARATGW